MALGGRGGKELVQVRPGAPGSSGHPVGAQLAAGRPTAWGWLDGQRGGRIGQQSVASNTFLLFSLTGPADAGELQPALGWASQEGTRENKEAFPNMLGVPSLRRSPQDTRAQVPALPPLMSNLGPGSPPLWASAPLSVGWGLLPLPEEGQHESIM